MHTHSISNLGLLSPPSPLACAHMVLLLLLLHQVVAVGTEEAKCKELEKQFQGVTGMAVDAKDIKQVRRQPSRWHQVWQGFVQ